MSLKTMRPPACPPSAALPRSSRPSPRIPPVSPTRTELSNVSYRYQWIAGGADIDGATGASLALATSQQGQTIQVRVTFTDDTGNSESLTSVATDARHGQAHAHAAYGNFQQRA